MDLGIVLQLVWWIGILIVGVLGSVGGWHFQQMRYNRRPDAPGSDHYYSLGAFRDADRYTAVGQAHRLKGIRFYTYALTLLACLVAIAVAVHVLVPGW